MGLVPPAPPQHVSLVDQYTEKETSIWHNQVISPAASRAGELTHLAAVGQTTPQLSGCSRRCRAPRLLLTLQRILISHCSSVQAKIQTCLKFPLCSFLRQTLFPAEGVSDSSISCWMCQKKPPAACSPVTPLHKHLAYCSVLCHEGCAHRATA